jgi:hypothetical protein
MRIQHSWCKLAIFLFNLSDHRILMEILYTLKCIYNNLWTSIVRLWLLVFCLQKTRPDKLQNLEITAHSGFLCIFAWFIDLDLTLNIINPSDVVSLRYAFDVLVRYILNLTEKIGGDMVTDISECPLNPNVFIPHKHD